jgi:oligopeptidase B
VIHSLFPAAVPFVDVSNTMMDETLPLTTNEYEEWGNPNQKVILYDEAMRSFRASVVISRAF